MSVGRFRNEHKRITIFSPNEYVHEVRVKPLLRAEGQVITAEHSFPKLPGPDDEAILAATLAGNANVFVTGDKALLNLESVEGLLIITPRGLWETLANE